jgi:hypothetical protein
MTKIYSDATMVAICLGEHAEDSILAVEKLIEIATHLIELITAKSGGEARGKTFRHGENPDANARQLGKLYSNSSTGHGSLVPGLFKKRRQ